MEINVTLKGPLFDGRADAEMGMLLQECLDRVAAHAIEGVQRNLNESIKNPTPYYETQVMISNGTYDRSVNDRGVIYGPWLEGTSHRNAATRFKGYFSFRRAADETRVRTNALISGVVAQHVRKMGG